MLERGTFKTLFVPCCNQEKTAGQPMTEIFHLGDMAITVTRKAIKNVNLSVHPPDGVVRVSAPQGIRLELVRDYVLSKLTWIRKQQTKIEVRARQTPKLFVEHESHYLWGRRYLLTINEQESRPFVTLDETRIFLNVRPGSDKSKRAAVMHAWHKALLHTVVPDMIVRWEPRLGVRVVGYFLQRMKTRWGSCNYRAGHIRLNTELVKKSTDLLEYVLVHEMVHLLEPSHNARFIKLLTDCYPAWREARAELNMAPLSAL